MRVVGFADLFHVELENSTWAEGEGERMKEMGMSQRPDVGPVYLLT